LLSHKTKCFIVPNNFWLSLGTIQYFTSSHLSIAFFLTNYWSFFNDIHGVDWTNRIRWRVVECINRTMKCNSWKLWFATFICKDCWMKKVISFMCHMRCCSTCSKALCDKRINGIRLRLPTHIAYIHITRTLPAELRDFWLQFRWDKALSILFNKAHEIIIRFFQSRFWCIPWVFSILHTFGSYINRNPHLHMVVSLGGLWEDEQRINIKDQYIIYHQIKQQRRALVIKECRKIVSVFHKEQYEYWKSLFEKTFQKTSWYVTVSEPIIEVRKVMAYLTRYMYRAPIAISKIINSTLIPNDIDNSTITVEYTHKKPRQRRIIIYTLRQFLWLLARHIPDKYFRLVRYSGIFSPNKKTRSIELINQQIPPPTSNETISIRPTTYRSRMIATFRSDPLACTCWWTLELFSLTYFSKRTSSFVTKYIDSS
jgi:Putative transposase/Transposase zinc-binding domain